MKKSLLLIVLTGIAISAFARLTSVVEFSVGGGWSSLGYKLNTNAQPMLTAKQPGSYGLTAHVGYGLMFNEYVGLGIGADISRYGSDTKLLGALQWKGVSDTEGEIYDHVTDIHGKWKDNQQMYAVEIPLTFYFRAPFGGGDVAFSGEVGAKIAIPVWSNATYGGSLTHTAFYDPWLLTLKNVQGHGFYDSEMNGSYTFNPRMTAAAFVKLGVEMALDDRERVWFLAHVYGNYHFMPAFDLTENPVGLGFCNDTDNPALRDAHYFMNDYNGILATDMLSGKPNPLSIGIEIGIRIKIPHHPKEPCHCVTD